MKSTAFEGKLTFGDPFLDSGVVEQAEEEREAEEEAKEVGAVARGAASVPQMALCGGIPSSFLEPSPRSWSHFVGVYRQILTTSLKN